MYEPCEDCECAGDPHEDKHCDANLGANVELRYAGNGIAEDDEHDGRDDGGDGDDECVEESEYGDRETEPACEDGEWHEEDEDEGQACSGEEEAEHPAGDVAD